MRYESIADLFAAKDSAREHLLGALEGISEMEAATLPDGEKWSIKQIVEHVSMVDRGIAQICTRLLADGCSGHTEIAISNQFKEGVSRIATMKLEAPDRVQPTGEVSVADAVKSLEQNRTNFEALRNALEGGDSTGTFKHPYLGPLTAVEWFVMAGLHERRHAAQIEKLAARIKP